MKLHSMRKASRVEQYIWGFARALPAILVNKMEESLRNLADSLGECSRLVSQVLTGSTSSSNDNITDSVTQGVSGNNFSSTSNVSNAVERARSMLQRSRSTGLCSRLSQRERLRAASPSTVPSSSGGKKQKTAPEQPKPFEFALMYVEDEDEEENLSINHDNILLRGFVNLVSTDGEAEIRSKIAIVAIRLKYPLVGNRDLVFLRANRRKLSIPVSCGEYSYKQVKLLCGQGAIYVKLKSGMNCLICDGDVNSSTDYEDLPGK